MHTDVSQGNFCARIYSEKAGDQLEHPDLAPAFDTYPKNPSVWTHLGNDFRLPDVFKGRQCKGSHWKLSRRAWHSNGQPHKCCWNACSIPNDSKTFSMALKPDSFRCCRKLQSLGAAGQWTFTISDASGLWLMSSRERTWDSVNRIPSSLLTPWKCHCTSAHVANCFGSVVSKPLRNPIVKWCTFGCLRNWISEKLQENLNTLMTWR